MGFGLTQKIVGGVVAGGIAIFGGVTAMDDKTARDDKGAIVESGGLGAFALRVGDCFMAPEEGTALVQSVEGVPCADPHDGQAYALFDVPDAESFDEGRIEQQAGEGCLDRWEVGLWGTYDENLDLELQFLTPSVESWAENDRGVVCLIVSADGSLLTGSKLAT